MIIGRVLSPVHSLGPGERVCLWTQGCSKSCPGCISPDLQPFHGSVIPEGILAQVLTKIARQNHCDGLTISGGDPFEQAKDLYALLFLLRPVFQDILVYTGFTLDQIRDGYAGEEGIACLQYIDVLIDGRYDKSQNTPDCILRGSRNQVIHFLDPTKAETYEAYMKKGRILECFSHGDKTIITGILNEEESQ